MSELGWSDRREAYAALRSTLHALRDRLQVNETVHLGSQMPLLLAGIYYNGWKPSDQLAKRRHKEDFFQQIGREFGGNLDAPPEMIASAVFRVMERRVDGGELQDVRDTLPSELREFWDASVSATTFHL